MSAASQPSSVSSCSPSSNSGMTAAVLGASGNVGNCIVHQLLSTPSYSRIILINRRRLEQFGEAESAGRLTQHIIGEMSVANAAATASTPLFQGVDALFIAMGIGSPGKLPRTEEGKQELMTVDCDVPTEFTKSAKANGVKHVSLVSAVGSDINATYSKISHTGAVPGGWYAYIKAKVEQNIVNQQLPSCAIFKPCAIIGNSNTGSFGSWLAPKFDWMLPIRYNSIHQDKLAQAMVEQSIQALATLKQKQLTTTAVATASDAEKPLVYVAEGQTLFSLLPADVRKAC